MRLAGGGTGFVVSGLGDSQDIAEAGEVDLLRNC